MGSSSPSSPSSFDRTRLHFARNKMFEKPFAFVNGYSSGAVRRHDILSNSVPSRVYRVLHLDDGRAIIESSKILRDWQQVGKQERMPELFVTETFVKCDVFEWRSCHYYVC